MSDLLACLAVVLLSVIGCTICKAVFALAWQIPHQLDAIRTLLDHRTMTEHDRLPDQHPYK